MTGYLGSKGGSGVWQRIAREVPPCEVLVSPFAGQCALLRLIAPPRVRIAIDRDTDVVAWWQANEPGVMAIEGDSITWLEALAAHVGWSHPAGAWRAAALTPEMAAVDQRDKEQVVFYLDPPYVLSTRTHEDSVYKCDMTDADHVRLLKAAKRLPSPVLISGYDSELYRDMLADWRLVEFTGHSRGGPRTEFLWSNRPTPELPHDERWLGTDRREREKLARRERRLVGKLSKLPEAERWKLFHAVAKSLGLDLAPPQSAAGSQPCYLAPPP